MARRDAETNPAAFLGDELRRARLAAGFSSQDALAGKLGFDRTVIAKAEVATALRSRSTSPTSSPSAIPRTRAGRDSSSRPPSGRRSRLECATASLTCAEHRMVG